jgi:excisionase family DNA binding protein
MPEQHFTDWNQLPLLLTTEEVADLLRVHINTVKTMVRAGKLPAVKVGRAWRIKRSDVLALLDVGGAHDAEEDDAV